jgi:hypothetical protein
MKNRALDLQHACEHMGARISVSTVSSIDGQSRERKHVHNRPCFTYGSRSAHSIGSSRNNFRCQPRHKLLPQGRSIGHDDTVCHVGAIDRHLSSPHDDTACRGHEISPPMQKKKKNMKYLHFLFFDTVIRIVLWN